MTLPECDWEIESYIHRFTTLNKFSSLSSSNFNKLLLDRFELYQDLKKRADVLTYTDVSDIDKLQESDNEMFNRTDDSLSINPLKNEYPGEDSVYKFLPPQHIYQTVDKYKSETVASRTLSFASDVEDSLSQERLEEDLGKKDVTDRKSFEVDVELASEGDLDDLLRISIKSFQDLQSILGEGNLPQGYDSKENIQSYIVRNKCFKISVGGQVVGGALVDGNDTNLFLTRIFIDSRYQNMGLGQILHENIENFFPDKESIETNTPVPLYRNINFYNKLGYEISRKRKTRYPFSLIYFKKYF